MLRPAIWESALASIARVPRAAAVLDLSLAIAQVCGSSVLSIWHWVCGHAKFKSNEGHVGFQRGFKEGGGVTGKVLRCCSGDRYQDAENTRHVDYILL